MDRDAMVLNLLAGSSGMQTLQNTLKLSISTTNIIALTSRGRMLCSAYVYHPLGVQVRILPRHQTTSAVMDNEPSTPRFDRLKGLMHLVLCSLPPPLISELWLPVPQENFSCANGAS